jgi:predicted enzyme related to lactoylglutathione lyase
MPKYWFDHIHSISEDPLRIAEFYEKMFRAERVGVETPQGLSLLVTLKLDDIKIKFMQPRSQTWGASSGLEHIALRTDNIKSAVVELEQSGAKIVREIIDEDTGGISFKSAFVSIDGNLIELQEVEN